MGYDGRDVITRRPCADMPDRMKVSEAIKLIESDGRRLYRTRGSHRQYKHPLKRGTVTIAGQLRDTLHPKTFKSILKQAQLEDGER